MNEAEARVQQELIAIVDVLSELTGLTSQWSGEVELSQDARAFGRKPFSCRIVLNERLADQPVRWRTLIHEALHSFSAGYNSRRLPSVARLEGGSSGAATAAIPPYHFGEAFRDC